MNKCKKKNKKKRIKGKKLFHILQKNRKMNLKW